MKIEKSEIRYLQKRRRDKVGELFEWNGKILRGIFPEYTAFVKELFESGFIPELVEKKLFPKSWITDYKVNGYGLVIEHEKIWPVIYPQEWSFAMLKDAALSIIQTAKIAMRYGFNMKDCHGLNILFVKNKPKFIDMGSFHKNKKGCSGWEPYKEFLRFYYYPLYTWKDGLEFISKLSIFSGNLTPPIEHYIYKYKLCRIIPLGFLEKLIKIRFLTSSLACIDCASLEDRLKGKNKAISIGAKLFKSIINYTNWTLSQDLNKLEKMLNKIDRKPLKTIWRDYHSIILKKKDRFNRIIQLINTYCKDAKTAVDIGGNQGLFSRKVLEETEIESVICQDVDEAAIDIGYTDLKQKPTNIFYVNYNFIAPIIKTTYSPPWHRFKSDIVFCLALLHHLILSQGFSLDDILKEIKKYTKKYVCIEFMPKGLWVQGVEVRIPEWYTVEWFRENFLKYFDIFVEEQIAENYIVYVGKLKESSANE